MFLNRIGRAIANMAIAITLFLGAGRQAIANATVGTPGDPNSIVYPDRANLPPDSFDNLSDRPNILYFQLDNLGFGEIGTYGGGIVRGTSTPRIDSFAEQGIKLLNFAPESQCTPSRSAIMTGRYTTRSGTHTVALQGLGGGIATWEKTMGDVLSAAGYNSYIIGKWHIGEEKGRLPTDRGFLHWYGVPRSYDEALYFEDPFYNPEDIQRGDPISHVVTSDLGGDLQEHEVLDLDVKRDLDVKYMQRAKQWMKESKEAGKPFFMYFNHTLMHMPIVPREQFKGKTGYGDNADCLYEMDHDFGEMLDYLDELGVTDNTIVVFAGENGPEEIEEYRGNPGFFEGSYFAGSEGNLRTPAIVRYPGKVKAGRESDDIVHITDMFTTLIRWAGAEIPQDRAIDGEDQRAFFEGKTDESAREGFPSWNGRDLYGAKWHHYKLKFYDQKYMFDPALRFPTPNLINLKVDPKERIPNDPRYYWVSKHLFSILGNYALSTQVEPEIPWLAGVDCTPDKVKEGSEECLPQLPY